MRKITVIIVGHRCKLTGMLHCVDVRIDIVHQRKAEALRLRGVVGRVSRFNILEVAEQQNQQIQKLRAQNFFAIGGGFRCLDLRDCVANQPSDRVVVKNALIGTGELLHNAFEIIAIGRDLGLKREKIEVQRVIRNDFVKFRRKGKVDIPLGYFYGAVVGVDRSRTLGQDCQLKPVMM